jgi:hypothetical protein
MSWLTDLSHNLDPTLPNWSFLGPLAGKSIDGLGILAGTTAIAGPAGAEVAGLVGGGLAGTAAAGGAAQLLKGVGNYGNSSRNSGTAGTKISRKPPTQTRSPSKRRSNSLLRNSKPKTTPGNKRHVVTLSQFAKKTGINTNPGADPNLSWSGQGVGDTLSYNGQTIGTVYSVDKTGRIKIRY